jgi:uncharacterized protein with ParB-like and HNH nuclease domain
MEDVYKTVEQVSKIEDQEPMNIPLKERRLLTMPYDYSIEVLYNQLRDKRLIIEEEGFQRKYVWDDVKASKLIESLILNVPIPVCYFSEEEGGIYSVIDGHQRLKSIHRFIDNQFSLKDLEVHYELNKKKYFELSSTLQRSIFNKTIRCIVLLQESHPDIRFDIFGRLNTGSVSLNAQELRNCVYRGPLNDLLKKLVKNQTWLKSLSTSSPNKRMLDREMILRFFALYENLKTYKKPMKSFLNNYANEGKNFDAKKIMELEDLFNKTIKDVHFVFGGYAFRKYSDQKWERAVNKALYDTVMLSFAEYPSEKIHEKKAAILNAYKEIQLEEKFSFYITQSTSDIKNVTERIKLWKNKLSTAIGG